MTWHEVKQRESRRPKVVMMAAWTVVKRVVCGPRRWQKLVNVRHEFSAALTMQVIRHGRLFEEVDLG